MGVSRADSVCPCPTLLPNRSSTRSTTSRARTPATARRTRGGRCAPDASRRRPRPRGSRAPRTCRATRCARRCASPTAAATRGSPITRPRGAGMAVKLYLDDGARTDMVALSLPVFFARTPEDFLEFTRARKPDPADRAAGPRADRRLVRRAPGGGTRDPGRGRRRRRRPATPHAPTTASIRSAG